MSEAKATAAVNVRATEIAKGFILFSFVLAIVHPPRAGEVQGRR